MPSRARRYIGSCGDVVAVELDGAVVGRDQAGDHVEAGGLAGAVGAQQAHHFAAPQASGRPPRTTGRLLKLLPMWVTDKPLLPSTTARPARFAAFGGCGGGGHRCPWQELCLLPL